jgi:predicted AlkP superfamily phosphohydrolase/phosphomutase
MSNESRILRRFLLLVLILTGLSQPALAYIGPGAGIAAAGSVLVLLGTFLLAFGIILIWPIKAVIRLLTSWGKTKARVKRVIVVGLDGLDPGLARKYMDEGLMPNFKRLEEQGHFSALTTSCPSISPVAWSSYATGVDASRHNIYDFLTRDPCSYLPVLSSSEVTSVPRNINLGFMKIPFGSRAVYRFLQRSQAFWKILGENRVWSSIIRVPITFPPQKFKNGTMLSGMCVPDLQGTQGSFSFYSTRPRPADAHIGGQQYSVVRRGNTITSKLTGPPGKDGHRLKVEFSVEFDDAGRKAVVTVGDETAEVGFREYTPWMRVPFKGASGIARFYIQDWDDEGIGIYVTPINLDPDSPAMPISHPFVYAIYLAKLQGSYATLGLAEDTWALNERIIDEEAFLKQAWEIYEERKVQLWDVMAKTKKGFVTVVFDTTDRVQHMFWRYLDPDHPANEGKDTEIHKNAIPDLYSKMDELLGEVQEKIADDPDTVLMVISDHGFTNFRRGVNLNTWLRDEGYLVLKEGEETSPDYFQNVDWSKTRAFTLGLTGVFINRADREGQGIVPKEDLPELCAEIKEKLEKLTDPLDDQVVVKEAFLTRQMHSGPYADAAPELLIGYNRGFRHSWDCATGSVSAEIFSDNAKSWSGDHCCDPRLVPGVIWCSHELAKKSPALVDMAPSVLDLFGVEIPGYMQGEPIFPKGPIELPSRKPVAAERKEAG